MSATCNESVAWNISFAYNIFVEANFYAHSLLRETHILKFVAKQMLFVNQS